MTWHYVLGNEQKGPVDQSEFERLVQQGVITGSTFVWRAGMANWQPYDEIAPSPVAAPPAGARRGGVMCAECGRAFAVDQVIPFGNGYVCAGCKPIAVQKLREGVVGSGAEQIRKEHISHEASVKSVGFLYFMGAAVWFLAGLAGVGSGLAGPGRARAPLPGAIVCVGLAAVLVWAGIGLRKLKRWARIPSGILSGLGLLAFPVGTLINGYILYLLFSKKGATVFSDDYQRIIQETPHIKYRTSIVIWILLGLVLLLIGAGFVAFLFAPRR